jgi:glycosyltransferase involved in cell wall biosynthesis
MYSYPKISIVTPSFNQGAFLEEAIQSVLDQNYPNLEYFVLDGGSSDNSVDIIHKYSSRLTYWHSQPDKGQSDAINQGFSMAAGEILAWINSDDAYYPGVLLDIAEAFQKYKDYGIIFGFNNDVDQSGRVIRHGGYFPFFSHGFRTGFMFGQPTSFWRREVWEKCGPLDTSLHYCMDYDFFAKALLNGYRFKSIHLKVCRFRYHSNSKTLASRQNFYKESRILMHNYFPEQHDTLIKDRISRIEYLGLRAARKIVRKSSYLLDKVRGLA